MNEITKYFPDLTDRQREQFKRLKPLYEEWNAKINVISRRDMEHFYEHHVLHSLAIARVCPFPDGARIMDVGTGGGFPGIPLAIMFPQAKFWLVDSIGKKISVVRGVVEALGLTNVVAVNARAETVSASEPFESVIPSERSESRDLEPARRERSEHNETFDWVVSRAVTDMKTFLTWVDGKIAPSAASPQQQPRHSERRSRVESASAASPPICHSERSEESSAGANHGILYLKGGDLTVEMQNAARPYTLYDIADLFAGDFFTTKHIVRIDY